MADSPIRHDAAAPAADERWVIPAGIERPMRGVGMDPVEPAGA